MIETYRGESFQFGCFAEAVCHSASDTKLEQHITGMAQRQRAGLITPRSPDRNGLPVSIPIRQLYRSWLS